MTDRSPPAAPRVAKGKSASDDVRQFTVKADDHDIRLDRWFKRNLPQIGFAMVSRWARTGQLRIDGKRADPADHVMKGQVLRIPPGGDAPPGLKQGKVRKILTPEQIEQAEAMVLEKDRAAIILNKPPGLATQGGSGTYEHVDGLLDAFVGDSEPRPRLVHRLDKDTSGVLLIARTPGSAAFFAKRFSGRTARKVYWALVVGVPSINDGLIELPLAKQPGTGGEKMMVDESEHGQSARTRYRVVDRAGNSAAWVELQPMTGRTHQLRVHMAAIGHPIVGDGKYGGAEAFLTGTISRKMHLHARRLRIDHPEGDFIDVTAPLPPHFAASLAQLGFSEEDGDFPLEPVKVVPEKTTQKLAAKAYAKQYRKERRGERRKRSEGPAAKGHSAPRGIDAPEKAAGGKPGRSARPAAGKPASGSAKTTRPSPGKPGAKTAGPATKRAPVRRAPAKAPPKGPAR
ncbi:RluA family pseudouridine synthase [Novosphingobium lentum]|uniref:RluA family pseudouridine synthase n=1 Tax=Novosphingobium lentum TaxID=145287 RepID=UPI00082ECF6C|nr:RluA family pseudouridine synthase [Novosphingobium lentum]